MPQLDAVVAVTLEWWEFWEIERFDGMEIIGVGGAEDLWEWSKGVSLLITCYCCWFCWISCCSYSCMLFGGWWGGMVVDCWYVGADIRGGSGWKCVFMVLVIGYICGSCMRNYVHWWCHDGHWWLHEGKLESWKDWTCLSKVVGVVIGVVGRKKCWWIVVVWWLVGGWLCWVFVFSTEGVLDSGS